MALGQILLPCRTWSCLVNQIRLAGHSKWANIKHTKMANDSARARLFARFVQRIKVNIQDKGDANLESNRALQQIVESAKRASMPMSTIQNAIKIAQTNKSKSEECFFEVRGPKGSIVVVLVITDNKKRTKDTIATILRKNNVTFADTNIVRGLFSRKGVIETIAPTSVDSIDKALEHAIESGAEDVSPGDSGADHSYTFYSDISHLIKTKKRLEELGYKILEADTHFIPHNRISLDDQDLAAFSKLCDKLGEHPDVIELYDNIA